MKQWFLNISRNDLKNYYFQDIFMTLDKPKHALQKVKNSCKRLIL